ncbi:glycoside hydrolase family 6 protein [Luteococcus sp. Sow4_B9]|uniref:glycoside hydrolase family 6 protein n=1 Tax=Luteococcus sp. Sow4_B9 TaxID=3438792 RepID=UPI003F999C80
MSRPTRLLAAGLGLAVITSTVVLVTFRDEERAEQRDPDCTLTAPASAVVAEADRGQQLLVLGDGMRARQLEAGWSAGETGWQVSEKPAPGTVEVHRLFHPSSHDLRHSWVGHEIRSAITDGYVDQGVVFHVSNDRRPGCANTAVYEGVNHDGMHRYGTDRQALLDDGFAPGPGPAFLVRMENPPRQKSVDQGMMPITELPRPNGPATGPADSSTSPSSTTPTAPASASTASSRPTVSAPPSPPARRPLPDATGPHASPVHRQPVERDPGRGRPSAVATAQPRPSAQVPGHDPEQQRPSSSPQPPVKPAPSRPSHEPSADTSRPPAVPAPGPAPQPSRGTEPAPEPSGPVPPAPPARPAPPVPAPSTAPRPAPGPVGLPAALTSGFYLDTGNDVYWAAQRETNPEIKRLYHQVAATPTFTWFDGTTSTDDERLRKLVDRAAASGTAAQLVIYGIPNRDCGLYSSGGQPSAAAYRAWIQRTSQIIGDRKAVVVLEPDAINFCGNDATKAERTALLRFVGETYRANNPQVALYLHAGSGEGGVDNVASAIADSGVETMRGFALNVASHQTTTAQEEFGEALVARLAARGVPNMHYVVDTARNGSGLTPNPGARYASCNNFGATLGRRPTTNTTGAHADAYLWVRPTGGSDGECGKGDPPAGTFFPEITQQVVRNSLERGTVEAIPLP